MGYTFFCFPARTILTSISNFIKKMADSDAIKKICDIYDWDGKGELDMFYLGDVVYALGFNITKKICVGLGQTDELNKKFAKYDDYIELCKLYDKNENGTMMLAELENVLSNLADEIPKEDTMALLAELCDPEDEDGFFPYTPFVDRLTGKS